MEHEMEVQKEDYEKKLFELSSRLESIETGMKIAEEKEEEKNNKDKDQLDELERLREEMSAKLEDVCTKVRVYMQSRVCRHHFHVKSFIAIVVDPIFPIG